MSIDYSEKVLTYKNACPKPAKTEKKVKKPIKGKKHRQTKEKEIDKSTKLIVWARDLHRCIFCRKFVPWNYANAHYIKRSAGGLGIEQNLFTACSECHREQDNGLNSIAMTDFAREYLVGKYSSEWNEKELIHRKY